MQAPTILGSELTLIESGERFNPHLGFARKIATLGAGVRTNRMQISPLALLEGFVGSKEQLVT